VGAVPSPQPLPVVLGCVVLAGAGLWVLLRPATGWLVLAGAGAVAVAVTVLTWGEVTNLGLFSFCVLAGWAAFRGGPAPAAVLTAGIVLVLVIQWVLVPDGGWGAWIAGTVFTVVIGTLARRQDELIEQLREAQAGLAEQARLEERGRIAREVHDVIGHSLTVSLLHVGSARLALEEDPAEAAAALEEAERLGRQSLAEIRQVVSLMRGDEGAPATPMPGADQIEDLVEAVRRAGTPVELVVVGSTASMTATAGLTAYRILQEALTNVARHAPGAATTVRVQVGPTGTCLVVDSDGPAGPPRADGVGVLSMRERAEGLGGSLRAGPHGAGWRVEAVLPG
jgi:signal transduction histidine kinase